MHRPRRRAALSMGSRERQLLGQPLIRQSPNDDTRLDWGGNFLLIGVDGAKDWCHAMLKQSRYAVTDKKTAVYPVGKETNGYALKYFEGLCAERKEYVTNRYGQASVKWIKDPATPNEPLDLYRVLARGDQYGRPRQPARLSAARR